MTVFYKIYKACVSPFLGTNCRFYPSCSEYSEVVVRERGLLKGMLLTLVRLSKCHPFHAGGVDLP